MTGKDMAEMGRAIFSIVGIVALGLILFGIGVGLALFLWNPNWLWVSVAGVLVFTAAFVMSLP